MVAPVVPNQFEVGKNKIVHKPTKAAFSFKPAKKTERGALVVASLQGDGVVRSAVDPSFIWAMSVEAACRRRFRLYL
jgi:hypothetical protein